jgi:phosphate:Na+ symporter
VFLDDLYLDQPAVALDRVKMELIRLGEKVSALVRRGTTAALRMSPDELEALAGDDQEIDELHGEILAYLGALSLGNLIEPQPRRVQEYLSVANYLENAADLVETDFVGVGRKRAQARLSVDSSLAAPVEDLHEGSWAALEGALKAFQERDVEAARGVLRSKRAFDRHAARVRETLGRRLTETGGEVLDAYRVTVELIESSSRLHRLARRLAQAMVEVRTPGPATRAGRASPGRRETDIKPGPSA